MYISMQVFALCVSSAVALLFSFSVYVFQLSVLSSPSSTTSTDASTTSTVTTERSGQVKAVADLTVLLVILLTSLGLYL